MSARLGVAASRGPWWEVFGDDDLDALAQRIDGFKQSLEIALARLRQARASADAARALLCEDLRERVANESLTSANLRYRAEAGHTLPD